MHALSCGGQTPPKRAWDMPRIGVNRHDHVFILRNFSGSRQAAPVETLLRNGLCLALYPLSSFEEGVYARDYQSA